MSYSEGPDGILRRDVDDPTSMRMHLYSNQCHDEAEVWCDDPHYHNPGISEATAAIGDVDCHACLQAAGAHGMAAMRRLDALLAIEDPDDDTAPRCSCEHEGSCRYCATESIVAVTGGARREDFLR